MQVWAGSQTNAEGGGGGAVPGNNLTGMLWEIIAIFEYVCSPIKYKSDIFCTFQNEECGVECQVSARISNFCFFSFERAPT